MALTDDQTAQHLQRLAALVAQRRAQLRLKKQEAPTVCGISYMTYWKIEDGQSVRPSSYHKLEVGFGFRAGSCKAVLEGASDSVALEDGTRLIASGQIRDFKSGDLEEERPGWLYWLNAARARLQVADAAYACQRWRDAADGFREALPALAGYPRDHAYYRARMEDAERRA